MNKFKLMLALLAAPSMVLASCGTDTPEVQGSVSKVSVICASTSVQVGKTITATVNVTASGGASKEVTWSSDDETVATVDSNGVITGLKVGTATITATSKFDTSKSGSVQISVVKADWSDDIKEAMEEQLGMVLPYFEGSFVWSVDPSDGSLLAESDNEEDTAKVIEAYDALEIDKKVEEDYVEYSFPTESEDLVVAVDVYAEEGKAYVEPYLAYKMLSEWPEEKVEAALDGYTELEPEEVPAAEGTEFGFEIDEEADFGCYVLVVGSYSSYVTKLQGLGWTVYNVDQQKFIITMVSPLSSIVIDIIVRSNAVFVANIYAIGDPVQPAAEWPADKVADMLDGYTEVEIPAAEGDGFVVEKLDPEEDFYYGYIQVMNGNYEDYFETLQGAGFSEPYFDSKYGCYTTFKDDLALDIFVSGANFYIQPYGYVAPAVEWPAEEVAAFCEGYTEVEIPAASGTEFYVTKLDPASSYGYFGLIQVVGGVYTDYLTTLEGAGFSVNYDETNDFYYAIKENLELDIFVRTGYFAIQAANYVDPTVWPAETIASFLEGHTEVEVPAATGDSFIAGATTGYYYGQVIVYGGVVADYCSTLEGAGFEVGYDETNECYTAHKDDLAIDIYEFPTYMGLGFYTYVAPTAEWPADLVAALLDGKTEVSIPEAEGTSFVVAPLTGFYFGSITISGGDMDTYLETLRSAEFSVAWDSGNQCYVASKDNLLMDIGENPDVEGEFQMLLYLKAAFPTADVAAAVQLLVPGSETVIPEFEAEEYQLQDARAYIGGFVLYGSGDSSLLSEYTGILDEAGWAVSELEEGTYGAVSPAEDIMLQISYSDYYGELTVYILTYTKPATEWPADEVAALVESIEAEGTVPAAEGLSFTCYEAAGYYPPQINVGVEEGTAEAAAAAYIADLKDAGFFLVLSSSGYDYYAEEGNTLALCVYTYGDSEFIIELGCLTSPAVKPLTEWPADAVAAIVEGIGAEGSTVPAFEGEGISFNVGSYYLTVNPGANDPEDLLASYITKLEGLGYFVCGDNYGDPIFALEGETLGISPYYYNGTLCVELMKLDSPAAPAVFPTAAVEAFFDGKTDEVVPAIVAYDFKTSDKTSYLEIKAYGGNVKDYMKVLSDAGWTADYDSSAYYNYATSPEGSIKMTLINYTSYVTLKLEYVPPKLTEWPADAIAEALGEKAKTTLPGITGEGLQFEFTDNGDDSMKLDVYGSTPSAYVSILEDAGFTVTEGSAEDQYWYLLSADKTVKVQVYDYMSAGQDYFRVKAYGQDPTWTGTSFDPAVVEEALGLSEGFIPAIADGTKFSFSQPSDNSFKVTVESGANYSNFIAALGAAGFEETSAGSNTFTKDNVVATVKIENPITQKYSVEYTVQSSPTPQGEWPLDQIKALLGDERGALLPEAVGATSVIVTGSEGDCNISITGVSAEAYKQALLDAGFSFDGMSYSKEDLYVDVTGSGDSCTVNAYYFDF